MVRERNLKYGSIIVSYFWGFFSGTFEIKKFKFKFEIKKYKIWNYEIVGIFKVSNYFFKIWYF